MLDEDIKFHKSEAKLSEDGFCPKCKEFHDQCSCDYFWVRKLSVMERNNVELHQKRKNLLERIREIEKYKEQGKYTAEECYLLLTESLARMI